MVLIMTQHEDGIELKHFEPHLCRSCSACLARSVGEYSAKYMAEPKSRMAIDAIIASTASAWIDCPTAQKKMRTELE